MGKKEEDRTLIDELVSAGMEVCGVLIVLMVDTTLAIAAAFIIGAAWLLGAWSDD